MLIKQIIEVFDLLDSPHACGEEIKAYLQSKGEDDITVKTIRDGKYATDFIKIVIAGKNGRLTGDCGAAGCDWRQTGSDWIRL